MEWKIAKQGLVPFGPGEGTDYVALILFAIVAKRIFILFTREKESKGTDGKTYPPLEKFPGGVVLIDDGQNGDSLAQALRREFRQEAGLPELAERLEIDWIDTAVTEIPNREGPGFHRKTFFVARLDCPEHPDMKLVTAEEIEIAFWGEASPGRMFPVKLPRAHQEALEFALKNLPIFKVPVASSGLSAEQEKVFLERVLTIEPRAELSEGEVQPLDGDGLTPFQRRELEKQEARMRARAKRR